MARINEKDILNHAFEQMFQREYEDETEIGPLQDDEVCGNIDPNRSDIIQYLIEKDEEKKKLDENGHPEPEPSDLERERNFEDNQYDEETELVEVYEGCGKHQQQDRLDCESIISTYSNLYNHPKIIYEGKGPRKEKIRINPKTGVPITNKPGLTAKNLKQLESSIQKISLDSDDDEDSDDSEDGVTVATTARSKLSLYSVRPVNETPEERKARKAAVKEIRRERREEKKANQVAFNEERKRLDKESLNLKSNLTAVKLVWCVEFNQ